MSEPAMQSPLHAFELSARAKLSDGSAGVWASEPPLAAYITLRGSSADTAFVAAASKALGMPLPIDPCTLADAPSPQGEGALKVLWLSPDEWMIVVPRPSRARMLNALNDGLKGIRAQVVDNSGGYTEVLLRGRNAMDVLTHTSVYDVERLDTGRVVGTTFGKSSIYLHRQRDGYVLLFRRSFADYIWRYLERAAGPYGFAVAKSDQGAGA